MLRIGIVGIIIMEWKGIDVNYLIFFIDQYFIPIFTEIQKNMCNKIAENSDPLFKMKTQDSLIFIGKLIKKLLKDNFKADLCRELKSYY